ncbi:MAG TPA: 30S ribosomal protein S1 [Terriglobales bacterium]|nr:30S ribosomal protein S1 [Terriglobales bacterium]
MPNSSTPESQPVPEPEESFDEILSQYERSHSHPPEAAGKQIEGTVIAVSAESVFVDIGFKTEGILPLSAFGSAGEAVKPGDKLPVSVTGRDPEGYYQLSRSRTARPTDWASLEQAFSDRSAIVGTVKGVVKGGLSVDVGVRAFLPASRSGARDAAEMEKLVGQEIRCRITKLDVADEDVVVDRRAVVEEEERGVRQRRYSEVREGETVSGVVRSLTDYGAFVDIGGVGGLLHVGDIAWARVNQPADMLSVGQQIEAKVLKVDAEKQRISLGIKQLQPDPWDSAADKYKPGERVRGAVTRVAGFGAFVELEPGIEGLIHVSEMSWTRKVRNPGEIVKPGETVEVVVLAVNAAERRISLGLKQAMGDPWADAPERFPVGSVGEGPVTSLTSFGAFVQLSEGVDGMIHVSDISAEKRINHPREVLRVGQIVRAQVLALDKEKRQLRLGMKQLLPTGLDEYLAEHKPGDVVTGRITEVSGTQATVELGENIQATCPTATQGPAMENKAASKADLSSLSSMLEARWKGGASGLESRSGEIRKGQVRSFRIARLDPASKKIELELA